MRMNNYLSRLAARSLGLAKTIEPRMPSIYEPHVMAEGQLSGFEEKILISDGTSHEMGPETSPDVLSSTNHRRREEPPSVDPAGNVMPQPKNSSPSLHPSFIEALLTETKDQSLSSARFKMEENAAENLQLRELRSTGTLPDHASYEAVSSAVTPERGAIQIAR